MAQIGEILIALQGDTKGWSAEFGIRVEMTFKNTDLI